MVEVGLEAYNSADLNFISIGILEGILADLCFKVLGKGFARIVNSTGKNS